MILNCIRFHRYFGLLNDFLFTLENFRCYCNFNLDLPVLI